MRFIKNVLEFITINRSGLFDSDYYRATYPEVKNQNPIMHYIEEGWKEGKNPSANFDTIYYLRENTDVRHARINPLVHFIKFGQSEERPPNKHLSKNPFTYSNWIDQYDTLTPEDITKIKAHLKTFERNPLISLLMPVYNTNQKFLIEALDSVLAQCYPNWECCIADDASTNPHIREILETYSKKDPRIKVVFRGTNGHISAASNSALALSTGEYIGLLDHDDVLREHALYMIVNEINRYPNGKMFYSDEDLTDEFNVRYEPYFKPDWNPDLFCGQNLISHFCVYGADEVRQVGGFREGYEGAQDWDLAMRVSEIVEHKQIRHIPHILYHWRATTGSTALSSMYKDYAKNAQYLTITSHYERMGHSVQVMFTEYGQWKIQHNIAEPKPLASIIIPTRNQTLLIQNCIENVLSKTQYSNYDILIVNNQSDDDDTLKYLDQLGEKESITILDYNYPFNYSAINNFAADFAKGEVLIFLNNDIEVISQNWLDEIVGHAIRPEIGAVGAMLYYPNDTIQHAGVVMGMKGIAGHIHYGSPRGTIGQRGRTRLVQNYSAVTSACMGISKEKFLKVGGFDSEHLPIAYNDIDLCLRLIQAGYRNLWTPHAELYHHESQSRDYENTPEKIARIKYEAAYLVSKWHEMIAHDPAYNPNLSLTIPDFSPAFPPRTNKPWINTPK